MSALPTGTVTFLFTDIEGSTGLLQRLGRSAYGEVLADHARLLREAIAAGHGVEVQTEGDAVFAAFPTAFGAVHAAVEGQRKLAGHPWPDGHEISVRMGVHSGEGVLGGDNYVGLDVHRAARIAAAGHGGQVLLSDATRALVADDLPDGVGLRDLGERRLKDLEQPIRIAQLTIDGLPAEFPELNTLDARPGNLPIPLTSFVGREREVARVKELIAEHRLLTLIGPGGSGKTRLALQVATELRDVYRHGAFFVDLAPIRTAALVPLTVAQALGLRVDPGGDATSAVRVHLRDRHLLLVVDNFEHLLDGAGAVGELLSVAPGLAVLATSRSALGIYGEQAYEVPPFQIPPAGQAEALAGSEAIRLFVDRARAVRPQFELTDDVAPVVAAIVGRLDGLPLAIELAASQVRLLAPQAILSRLEQHLSLATAQARGRPERQLTMRNAIAWSYELLEHSERRLFGRLSAFAGGCSLAAVEAVCDAGDLEWPVLDGVARLVDKHLVRPVETAGGEPRFGMLETIRDFAAERLAHEFDADDTLRRLAAFFTAFAEEAEAHLTKDDQVAWLDRCELDRDNFRAAIHWAHSAGEAEAGLRIAAALWRFWQQRGPIWEGREVLDQLLALGGASAAVRARALGAAGGLAWWGNDFGAVGHHYEEALPLARESGETPILVEALYNRAFVAAWNEAEGPDVAEELFREGLALAESSGDRKGIALAQGGIGFVLAVVRGDAAAAVAAFEAALSMFEEMGERTQVSDTLVSLGNAYRRLGKLERARDYYLRGLAMLAAAGNRQMTTGLLFLICALESERGEHARVARLWGAAEAAREVTGAIRPPVAGRLIGDPVAAARAAIGDDAVERALGEGRAMDLDAAIAYAHAD